MNPRKKLYYIKWIDSMSPTESGWMGDDEIDECMGVDLYIEDVGFLYKEDKKYLTIVGGQSLNEDVGNICHRVVKIPKVCIEKKIDLTRYLPKSA